MYRIEEDAASPELALTLCRENGAQRLVMISMKVGVRKKELVGLKGALAVASWFSQIWRLAACVAS